MYFIYILYFYFLFYLFYFYFIFLFDYVSAFHWHYKGEYGFGTRLGLTGRVSDYMAVLQVCFVH